MHDIRVDRYVRFNKDVWLVECAGCGMVVDDLGTHEAAQVATVLARRMCDSFVSGALSDRARRDAIQDQVLSDERIVAIWANRDPSGLR